MKYRVLATLIMVISLSACNKYIKTNDYPAASRGENCDFRILTVPPSESYKELGIIKFFAPVAITSDASMKRSMQDQVCVNGGNAVLLVAPDQKGNYTSGSVLLVDY